MLLLHVLTCCFLHGHEIKFEANYHNVTTGQNMIDSHSCVYRKFLYICVNYYNHKDVWPVPIEMITSIYLGIALYVWNRRTGLAN